LGAENCSAAKCLQTAGHSSHSQHCSAVSHEPALLSNHSVAAAAAVAAAAVVAAAAAAQAVQAAGAKVSNPTPVKRRLAAIRYTPAEEDRSEFTSSGVLENAYKKLEVRYSSTGCSACVTVPTLTGGIVVHYPSGQLLSLT
jgi:ADP-ribosylglycohydrolase